MDVFASYMGSNFAKQELSKIAEEITYPKAPARLGAIFNFSTEGNQVTMRFYLRAGLIAKTQEGNVLTSKEKAFQYFRQKYSDTTKIPDEKIHEKIQDMISDPRTIYWVRKKAGGRSPQLVYTSTFTIPQLETFQNRDETKVFLTTLLRNGVFDPILTIQKEKSEEAIGELESRMNEVSQNIIKHYPIKEKSRSEKPSDDIPDMPIISSTEGFIKTAANDTWWYADTEKMSIEGPFESLDEIIDAQDIDMLQDPPLEDEQIQEIDNDLQEEMKEGTIIDFPVELPETVTEQEELPMAANINTLKRLIVIADKLDAKGEIKIAEQLDKIITEFHPGGGTTTQLDNPVKGDGAKVETDAEAQAKDLAVANKAPTGIQAPISA